MGQMTYRTFSEIVIKAHYVEFPSPEQSITTRFVAERAAMKVAKAAFRSAYGNSNSGEAFYANDQFISVFYSCPLLTNSVTQEKYIVMPSTPAGLANGREIAQVSFTGNPNVWCVPMQNRSDFVENGLPIIKDTGIQLFKVEDGNIVFPNLPPIVNSPVNLKLVGAIPPGTTILDSFMNVPKDVQDDIMVQLLQELAIDYKVKPETLITGEPS